MKPPPGRKVAINEENARLLGLLEERRVWTFVRGRFLHIVQGRFVESTSDLMNLTFIEHEIRTNPQLSDFRNGAFIVHTPDAVSLRLYYQEPSGKVNLRAADHPDLDTRNWRHGIGLNGLSGVRKRRTGEARPWFEAIKKHIDAANRKDGYTTLLGHPDIAVSRHHAFFPGTPDDARRIAATKPPKAADPDQQFPDLMNILPGRWTAWKHEDCPPVLSVRFDRAAVKWLQRAQKEWARGCRVFLETGRPPLLHSYTPEGKYAGSLELEYSMPPARHGDGDGWWWRILPFPHQVHTAQEMEWRLYGEGSSWMVLHKEKETMSGVFLTEHEPQRYYALPAPTGLSRRPAKGLAGGLGDRAVPGEEVVYHASTRGGRYRVVAMREADGTYSATWYTRGNPSGRAVGYNALAMRDRLAVDLIDAREVDGIRYNVLIDSLGVGLAAASLSKRRGSSLGTIGGDHLPPTVGGVLLLSSAAIGIACVVAARRLAP